MTEFTLQEVPTETVATIRRVVPMGELASFLPATFGQIAGAVGPAGGQVSGPPFAWYHSMPTDTVDVSAGFPVAGDVHTPDGGVLIHERPGGRAAVGIHVGPYDTMTETYDELRAWLSVEALVPTGDMWEEYLTPPEGDPSTWQTRIVTLVR